jgi:hypothetical protein
MREIIFYGMVELSTLCLCLHGLFTSWKSIISFILSTLSSRKGELLDGVVLHGVYSKLMLMVLLHLIRVMVVLG